MTLDFSSAFLKSTTSVVSRQDVENFYGFGLLLYFIHYFCQIPSPTAFITIPTSAANRQDVIVYYTVTLAVPWCIPNFYKQGFSKERERTKYCQNLRTFNYFCSYIRWNNFVGEKGHKYLSWALKRTTTPRLTSYL